MTRRESRDLRDRFWERFALEELTRAEWEALCDGCGLCCLIRIIDEDDPEERVRPTRLACRLYDCEAMACGDYANRKARVPECLVMTPELARTANWLPQTCAYRRRAAGRSLPAWHHLITGDEEAVHAAGVSLRGRLKSESAVAQEDWPDHIAPELEENGR